MDFPFSPHDCTRIPHGRGPVALWLIATLAGIVIGAASVAAAFATDGRDFAARHGSVLATAAL